MAAPALISFRSDALRPVEIIKDRLRAVAAILDRPDHKARPAHDVAHGIDTIKRRCPGDVIGFDRAPACLLYTSDAADE